MRRRVHSTKLSVSARQLSSSTPIPKCPVKSAVAVNTKFGNSEVGELNGLGQDVKASGRRALNICEFFAKFFRQGILSLSVHLDGLFAEKLETLIYLAKDFIRDKDA